MSGSSATSTLDIVLKDDVSGAAKAIAASLEKVQAEAKSVDEALGKSGTRSRFQDRLKSLGASREQIEGAAKAWKDYAAAEGLAMEKAGQWTAKQAAQAKVWEDVAVAKLRADRGLQRAQEFAAVAEARKAEERQAREEKARVETAARSAQAEATARERVAEMAARDAQRRQERDARDQARRQEADAREAERDAKTAARDEQRRTEQAARDSTRAAETEARDHRRLAEQEERDERQRVERRMRDDRMLAEHRAREEKRAAEAAHRHEEQLAHQREHAIAHHGIVNFALTSAAMAVSAHAIVHGGEQAWEHGAELQHERLGLRNAGRTPEQVAEIEQAGRDVIANTPTASMVESMKVVAETTAAFGSVHHAIENLPFMMKAMSILKTAGGDNIHGDAASVGQAFAKTFEERQTKPEEFEAEAKAMIPAMVATGGVFNPEQLYAFAQQAKSALPSLSMRFLSKIAPSLIGAQGGERAGTALKAFEDVIAGKVNDKKQAEAFLNLGLLDKNMAIMKAGHAVGWKSGAVKDTFLAMTDPLAWSEKYLIPALQKQGVDTSNREAVQMILNTMFRNQNANMFATEIAQEASRQRLHKDEALFSQTAGFDEIYKRNLQDFGVASGALKEALGNLAAAATAPLMHMAANGLVSLATKLNGLAELALQHPNIASGGAVLAGGAALGGAGWLSYQLMNGFGLGKSAVALDAAAAHLMEVGGGPGGVGRKLPPGAIVPGGGAIPEVVGLGAGAELGAGALAFGGGIFLAETVRKAFEAQQPGQGGLYAAVTAESAGRDRQDIEGLKAERAELQAKVEQQRARQKLPGEEMPGTYADRERIAQLDAAIARKEASLNDVEAVQSPEARAGRAFAAMKRPEEFGPEQEPPVDREAERGRGYMGLRRPEEFGPEMPRDRPWAEPAAPPAPAPPPVDHALDGFVTGSLAPKVDTSSITAAADAATQAGGTMQTALNVTAAPQVDASSIHAATAAAEQLLAALHAIGGAASAAGAAVAAIGGAGARPAGPSLASRGRGSFSGSASSIG